MAGKMIMTPMKLNITTTAAWNEETKLYSRKGSFVILHRTSCLIQCKKSVKLVKFVYYAFEAQREEINHQATLTTPLSITEVAGLA